MASKRGRIQTCGAPQAHQHLAQARSYPDVATLTADEKDPNLKYASVARVGRGACGDTLPGSRRLTRLVVKPSGAGPGNGRFQSVGRALKPLVAGVLIGVVGALLIVHFAGGSDKSIPERLEEALHCDDGVTDLPAAIAHRTAGFSEWATTHADRISGIGCDAGPATVYMHYSPYGPDTKHALATLDGYGPVCVVDHGFFGGRSLNQGQLPELCDSVGGMIAVT